MSIESSKKLFEKIRDEQFENMKKEATKMLEKLKTFPYAIEYDEIREDYFFITEVYSGEMCCQKVFTPAQKRVYDMADNENFIYFESKEEVKNILQLLKSEMNIFEWNS